MSGKDCNTSVQSRNSVPYSSRINVLTLKSVKIGVSYMKRACLLVILFPHHKDSTKAYVPYKIVTFHIICVGIMRDFVVKTWTGTKNLSSVSVVPDFLSELGHHILSVKWR